MSSLSPLPVNTASKTTSIWRDVEQSLFRQRIDDLHRKTDHCPGRPREFSQASWQAKAPSQILANHVLPFQVEERIANDIAFVAASRKDVESVSAVALEEHRDSQGLSVRIAANGSINSAVIETIEAVLSLLQDCARKKLSRILCKEQIFDKVVDLNRERIHARLQSKHYVSLKKRKNSQPGSSDRQPLGPELQKLARRPSPKSRSLPLIRRLTEISVTYSAADSCIRDTESEKATLKSAVRQSYDLCTPDGQTIEQAMASYGLEGQDVLANKHIRQLGKLARYYGLCPDLVEACRKYPTLFQSVQLHPVPRYEKFSAPVAGTTTRIPCFVHAEIQLLVHYSFSPNRDVAIIQPRVLGVSKAACYLCDLFIHLHAHFYITKTHGRLYQLWNVPDLSTYSSTQRPDIRRILKGIDKAVTIALKKRHEKRPWPGESYVHLPAQFLSSPAPSSTVDSDRPKITDAPPTGALAAAARNSATTISSDCSFEQAPTPPADLHQPIGKYADHNNHQPASPIPSLIPQPLQPPTPHPAPSASITSSTLTTLQSHHPPLHRPLTPTIPFLTKAANMILHFSIEPPAHGSVRIAPLPTHPEAPGNAALINVDVAALVPGEDTEFAGEWDSGGGRTIVLELHSGRGKAVGVRLCWD